MTDQDIRSRAPSVFATSAYPGVSDRYSFVPTTDILNAMRKADWFVVEAKEQRVRGAKLGFQKHQLKFQQRNVTAVRDEFMPEISYIGSHDRTSTSQVGFALWRFTCSNGLMVSDGQVTGEGIRHVGNAPLEVVRASNELFAKLPAVVGIVEKWQTRILSREEEIEFATRALALRYETPEAFPVRPLVLLDPRRNEDAGHDLWTVMNRVQENIMRGGLKDGSRRTATGDRFTKTRAINSLDVGLSFNRDLWTVATQFANN